jgi:hypothetical protein
VLGGVWFRGSFEFFEFELFLPVLFWFWAFLSYSLPFFFEFELFLLVLFWVWAFLSSSLPFAWFAVFHAFCWLCGFSFFWMTLLSFFFAFGLLVALYGVLDSNFKFCAFCCQCTHQGGRLRNQMISSLVGLWWVIDKQGLNSNPGHFRGSTLLPLFMWRITFACLVVCS